MIAPRAPRATAEELEERWAADPRWRGIRRFYTAEEVVRLRGSLIIEHSLARLGAEKLWDLLHREPFVPALGALTGMQAVQMVRGGLRSIYASGWQVAADNNLSDQVYPDQSLYPANSMPALVRRINNALRRADEVAFLEGDESRDWLVPIVADGEAGFGGPLNTFELTKGLIEAGAAGVHFEDQLASAKKCGHMGGKVLIPPNQHRRSLTAARLAADVLDIPTILIARTDALAATLLASDVDPRDGDFLTGERTIEGHWVVRPGIDAAIRRGLAYAPYADMLWFETNRPDMEEARRFAQAIHEKAPGKLLAYNCSPSFNWEQSLSPPEITEFQARLGELGYRFQFVTLAGFHAMNTALFELAHEYAQHGMPAYVGLQAREFELQAKGFTAVRHQHEVGTSYFDEVAKVVVGRDAGTLALKGSTESSQFRNGVGLAVRVERRTRDPPDRAPVSHDPA